MNEGRPEICVRWHTAFANLRNCFLQQGRRFKLRSNFGRDVYAQAAHMELQAALREMRHARLGYKAFYRQEIGEALPSDSWWHLPGETLFHEVLGPMSTLDYVMQMRQYQENGEAILDRASGSVLDALVALTHESYWLLMGQHDVICAATPRLEYDTARRLHCENGPALVTRDGHELFALEGVWVPRDCVVAPRLIELKDIETQPDEGARARMIETYGLGRYVKESGALLWDKSEFGELYWKSQHAQSPLLVVRVRNRTPESDGSYTEHWIRVPPHVATAREAVAWTFAMEERDYQPSIET